MECKNIVNGKVQRLIKNSKNGFERNIFFHIQYFKSSVAQKRYLIFHDFNCKIKLLCAVCQKIKMQFNVRLNNHHKELNKYNALQADQYF